MGEIPAQKVVGICPVKKQEDDQYRDPPVLFARGCAEDHECNERRTEQQQHPVGFYQVRDQGNEQEPFESEVCGSIPGHGSLLFLVINVLQDEEGDQRAD